MYLQNKKITWATNGNGSANIELQRLIQSLFTAPARWKSRYLNYAVQDYYSDTPDLYGSDPIRAREKPAMGILQRHSRSRRKIF